jgi:exosortase/archaeosortase family protein
VVLNLLVWLFPPLFFENLTAHATSGILNISGIPNSVETNGTVSILLQNPENTIIAISDLCTGLLETIILVSAIAATMEIHWKKRAVGAVAAVVGIFVFNQIRIVSTIYFILNAPLAVVELSHDTLFRVFLFVAIAVFYWLFLKWGKAKQQLRERPVKFK